MAAGLALFGAVEARAADVTPGNYLCTVKQKAGIGRIHIEGAGPPKAFTEERKVAFKIAVMLVSSRTPAKPPRYRVIETAYDGPDRDDAVWQTPNAVLHSAYLGDGAEFKAGEDQGFLRLGPPQSDGGFWFYHSAFEYPGGEDTNLSVRWGTCVPSK